MNNSARPVVIVSKCIEHEACRYNGEIIKDEFVRILKDYVDFVPVCPEVEIGLGVPRKPVRLVKCTSGVCLYQPSSEYDCTDKMRVFAKSFLEKHENIDGFILKHKSPSCGLSGAKLYVSKENPASNGTSSGLFAQAVLGKYPLLPVEDEGRLKNYIIRDNFLVSIFIYRSFRDVYASRSFKNLLNFHSDNKLLFMAYNEAKTRRLGKIVASHNKLNTEGVFNEYKDEFYGMFIKPAKPGRIINSLQHCFGGVSKGLSKEERKFFKDTLEEYRDERTPLSGVLHLLHSYAVRFNNGYLLSQSILKPYPTHMLSLSDSGKGRRF